MNKGEITEVLKELGVATGFRISLHDASAEEICAYPAKTRRFCARVQTSPAERLMCERCDNVACKKAVELGGTYSYKCRYGLTEIVSPIYNYGRLVGFLMMGQTAESAEDKAPAEEKLKSLGTSESERRLMLSEIPVVGKALASSFAKILTICAKYLTISGAVLGDTESIAESAMRFINENYSSRIHIKDICSKLGCSKSTLLASFKSEYGTTVNAALCKTRLKAARNMLAAREDESINGIALKCGFSDQSYFCKVFSSEYGESPSEYKKRVCADKSAELSKLPAICTKSIL